MEDPILSQIGTTFRDLVLKAIAAEGQEAEVGEEASIGDFGIPVRQLPAAASTESVAPGGRGSRPVRQQPAAEQQQLPAAASTESVAPVGFLGLPVQQLPAAASTEPGRRDFGSDASAYWNRGGGVGGKKTKKKRSSAKSLRKRRKLYKKSKKKRSSAKSLRKRRKP